MNRLERMLEYLYQRDSTEIDWVEVAFRFGFSDQPHLMIQQNNQIYCRIIVNPNLSQYPQTIIHRYKIPRNN